MSLYHTYRERESQFLALTGYTLSEFDVLLPHFQQRLEPYLTTHTLEGKPRSQRAYVP